MNFAVAADPDTGSKRHISKNEKRTARIREFARVARKVDKIQARVDKVEAQIKRVEDVEARIRLINK